MNPFGCVIDSFSEAALGGLRPSRISLLGLRLENILVVFYERMASFSHGIRRPNVNSGVKWRKVHCEHRGTMLLI